MCRDPKDVSLHVQLKFVKVALQGTSELGPDILKAHANHVFMCACFLVLKEDLLHLVDAILIVVCWAKFRKTNFKREKMCTNTMRVQNLVPENTLG